jgi:murein DD-endopeptidase MepM/ murein hydrolase activator NlpD
MSEEQPPTRTPTPTTQAAEGFHIKAERHSALLAEREKPGPYGAIDPTNRCLARSGTELILKEAPKVANDGDQFALVELLSPAPAANPADAGMASVSFANETADCPHMKVWISIGAWISSAHAAEVNDNSATRAGTINGASPGCCEYPLKARAPTCGEAGGGAGGFGSGRGGGRLHGGCDLYGNVGTPIYAIDDGVVLDQYYFYCDTDALEVRHGNRVVRYSEIKSGSAPFPAGTVIKKGQKIAAMGRLSCYYQPMLHFELYSGEASGPLTTRSGSYQRRSDLQNPTQGLMQWRTYLP